ncbi:hypothetical protein FF1_032665 [Malus domestica]
MTEESSVNHDEETRHNLSPNFSDVEVNTNQRLCSVLLNEFNYLPWSRAVSLALGGKGKLGFVNGSVEAPDSSSSTYNAWLCKDQLVMSLLLNTMEKHVAEIFSYSNSAHDLWKALQDMYGNQNNYARVFQLKKDIASAQQEGKAFVQHLGSLKAMWNELDVYLPHTTDPTILLKRAEEDKIYQLLGSLSSEYEDLRSHILMSQDLPTFNNVCATIQREEARKKVMNVDHNPRLTETQAYASKYKNSEAKVYKGRNTHLKCKYCNGVGHEEDKCWELHPELKPKFSKDGRMIPRGTEEAHMVKAMKRVVTQLCWDNLPDFLLEMRKFQREKHQDVLTMKMIGEGVFINGLYYLCKNACFTQALQAQSKSIDENQLWHRRLAHPSELVLRSDNGTEFLSNNMLQYISSQGIIHQTSCVGTPQQNGVAERKNRDLLEKTRALMIHMHVPKKFWSFAILTATYLINRLPSRVLGFKSPYEVLKGRKIDLTHLKVFGCVCFVHIQTLNRDKLDARATKCVFMGYSTTQKGYKCFNPVTKKCTVSRDVKFKEDYPYFTSQGEDLVDMFPLPQNFNYPMLEKRSVIVSPDCEEVQTDQITASESEDEPYSDPSPPSTESQVIKRNPPRIRKPPARLQDYVTYASRHPINECISFSKFSTSHAAFLSEIDKHYEPRSFQEASLLPQWNQAMKEEIRALEENCTWSLVQLPSGKKAVGSRWIYKTKFKADGSIERHKARLVARGFTQTFGVDYKETFAPVAKMNSVRVLLSVAINCGWSLYQMDVKNAFLHGELQEEVYMQPPPGYDGIKGNMVCKLHKAIYGLKQSPRAWYAKLSSVLEKAGFMRSNADSSLFVRTGTKGKLVVLVYVDDLIITGDNTVEIEALKLSLHQAFAIKDLGRLKYFLGIEMATSSKGLFLHQRKYVLDLLQEAKMLDCKPAITPVDCKLKLSIDGEAMHDVSYYQRLVGKLIYLTITRPDITYAVSLASQFMHSPTVDHLNLVKRILRYLKGSIGQGITMHNNQSTVISGYTDADWAGNAIDRKSITGYCTFVGGNLVTWKSKKQQVIARSSAEAEYRAMAATACELIWLKGLLSDLGFPSSTPMTLMCDNQAAMHIAANPVFHERTKHIEVDCHFIRAQVQTQIIRTMFTRSHDQLADLFTKALASSQFHRLLGKLGSVNPLDPA